MRLAFVLFFGASVLFANDEKPVAGHSFTITYHPSSYSVLGKSKSISVVYAFDYWGTSAHQVLRGESGSTDLFLNVLNPDPGRARSITMDREGDSWRTVVQIPPEAKLLSWYFTDGTTSDYNEKHTYVSYVYDESGKPVRGARFANVDFLFLAGKSTRDVLDEIRGEMSDYPDNLVAHVVYWRFQYFDTISPDTLKLLMQLSDEDFSALQKQYGDSVLNYQVMSLGDVNRIIWLSLIEHAKESSVAELIRIMKSRIMNASQRIPQSKRISRIEPIIASAKDTSAMQYDIKALREQSEKQFKAMLMEFVDQPAPDFQFQTVTGEKHKLSDFRGKVVLLDFWGSWCGPCVGEIPSMKSAYEDLKDRGIIFISISNDRVVKKWSDQDLLQFTEKNGMTWIQVLDDDKNTLVQLYKVNFWPNSFLIGRDGKVITRENLRGIVLKKTLVGVL